MSDELSGKKVAILAANGFEQVELTEPKRALEEAGARVSIVSPESGKVKGWKTTNWGDELKVDLPLTREGAHAHFVPVNPNRSEKRRGKVGRQGGCCR